MDSHLVRFSLVSPAVLALLALLVAASPSNDEILLQQTLAVTLGGQEVGTVDFLDRKVGDHLELSRVANLKVKRGETLTDMKTVTVVKIKPDLTPLSYHYERTDAAGTLVADGVLRDGKLLLKTTQNGASVSSEKAMPAGTTFMTALEHELRRDIKAGVKMVRSVVIEEMGAQVEMTCTIEKSPASRDNFLMSSSFMNLSTTEEVTPNGRTVVQRTPGMGVVAYPIGHAPPDIVKGTADLMAVSTWKVKAVDPPVSRVLYRITAPDMSKFDVPEDERQDVKQRTATSVTVEVKSGDTFTSALGLKRKQELLSATPYEAVDDPRIKKAAREATKGASTRLEEIEMLVQFVHDHVETKGLDRGYAPAVTTLEAKSGDCTEHSVLLSALLKARGFPVRLVDGVVVSGTNAGYHEWVEVYVEGRGFVPADPTFGEFPAGPERLKLAVGSTIPDDHLQLSLAAARLLKSGVKLEVLDTDP
jgi:hypothetical protein